MSDVMLATSGPNAVAEKRRIAARIGGAVIACAAGVIAVSLLLAAYSGCGAPRTLAEDSPWEPAPEELCRTLPDGTVECFGRGAARAPFTPCPPSPNVIRVERATGFVVDLGDPRHTWILTGHHVIAKNLDAPQAQVVGDQWSLAPVMMVWREADLALLRGPPSDRPAVLIAAGAPRPGELVVALGHDVSGRYGFVKGTAARTMPDPRAGVTWQLWSGRAYQGQSGGPIVDARGHVVGITFYGDRGAAAESIRNFLAAARAQIERRREPPSSTPAGPAPDTSRPSVTEAAAPGGTAPPAAQGDESRHRHAPGADATESRDAGTGRDRQDAGQAPFGEAIAAEATTMLTAWLITLGVPTGGATLAALAVWWLARRALKRRPSRAEPRPTAERLADAVVVQTQPPPAPQRVVRTTEYVQVRVPTPREKALDEAFTLYVRNYPGGVAAVETIREYARQIESGLTQKET